MTDVWPMRHRLLMERLETLLHRDEIADEETARLVCAAYVTLRRHRVDKRGRCRHCHRAWWLPRLEQTCTVHQVFALAMEQPFDFVWGWAQDR